MSVTYTKTAWPLIEKAIRDFLNDEFDQVYTGKEKPVSRHDESIRIYLDNSEPLQTNVKFEIRQYNIIIEHYFKKKKSLRNREWELDRVDRLKKLLLDNQCIGTSYFNLIIENIQYEQDDEEDESIKSYMTTILISVKNLTQWS